MQYPTTTDLRDEPIADAMGFSFRCGWLLAPKQLVEKEA